MTAIGIDAAVATAPQVRRRPLNPSMVAGSIIIVLVGFVAIIAPLLAHADPNLQDLTKTSVGPAWLTGGSMDHLLGTDHLGRDMFARILFGSRIAAIVGLSVVLIGGTIGVMLGLLAGYAGGWIDDLIGRIVDVQLAFPFILLAVALVAVLGSSVTTVIAVLGITSWVQYVRVVRAETKALRQRDFIMAAHATGATHARIVFVHILPNIASVVIVLATFEVARAIILESALSFLGLGVPQAIPSWGAMLADGRQFLDTAWWIGTFPGLAIMLTVLGVNVFGDGLRDYVDPRSRGR